MACEYSENADEPENPVSLIYYSDKDCWMTMFI